MLEICNYRKKKLIEREGERNESSMDSLVHLPGDTIVGVEPGSS